MLVNSKAAAAVARLKNNSQTWQRDDKDIAALAKKINRAMRSFEKYGYQQTAEYKAYKQIIKSVTNRGRLPETIGGVKKLTDKKALNFFDKLQQLDSSRFDKRTYDKMIDMLQTKNKKLTNTDAKKLLGDTVNDLKSEIWRLESKLSTMGYGTRGVRDITTLVDKASAKEQAQLFIDLLNAKDTTSQFTVIQKFNNSRVSASRPFGAVKKKRAASGTNKSKGKKRV